MNARTSTFFAAICAAAGVAVAQAPGNDAYLIDGRGVVARSGFGLCWQTVRWTPAMAIAECDPDLAPRAEAKPEPKMMAAAARPAEPAPALKPTPKPPVSCGFSDSLQSDATFVFGKAKLTAEAARQLDAMAVRLGACAQVTRLRVVGHTDRIGGVRANQRLSEQRAMAVSGYLAGKGVKADHVDIAGAGPLQPVAGTDCGAKLSRKQMIACLAPNRRVVVEAEGVAK